jgi:hypothetical protein
MVLPTFDQVQRAAYSRWERRGYTHGNDGDDWLGAEQELLFALNYEVAARYRLVEPRQQVLGEQRRPVCRFCERAAPATTFARPSPAVPACLGNATLFTAELCDECRDLFEEGIDRDLARFVASSQRSGTRPIRIPTAALKGFARVALAIMPRSDVSAFDDTIEWVSNTDHEFDEVLFHHVAGYLHLRSVPSAEAWVALARRTSEDAPMPYMILFAATTDAVFQVPVPLCVRDEDLDGETVVVPRLCSPLPWAQDSRQDASLCLPISSSDANWAAVSC